MYNHTTRLNLILVHGLALGTRPCPGWSASIEPWATPHAAVCDLQQAHAISICLTGRLHLYVSFLNHAFRFILNRVETAKWLLDGLMPPFTLLQAFFAPKPVAKQILVAYNRSFLKNNVKRKRRRVFNAWWRNSPALCARYRRYTYCAFF